MSNIEFEKDCVQPASALIGEELELRLDDLERVVTFPGKVAKLKQAETPLKPVDQLANARQIEGLKREKEILQRKRQRRLDQLKVIFSKQPAILKTLGEIEVIERQLATLKADSMEAQTLYFQKSMMAAMYHLPLAYVEADTLSWQIDSLNALMMDIIKLTTKLPADDKAVIAHQQKLENLGTERTELWKALIQKEKELANHTELNKVANSIRKWSETTQINNG